MANWKNMFSFVDEHGDLRTGKVIWTSVLGVILVWLVLSSFSVMNGQQVGVSETFGNVDRNPKYGLTFKFPIITHMHKFDKTVQRFKSESVTYTKDLQPATVAYTVNYRIVDSNAPELYRSVGKKYEEKIVDPAVRAALKAVFGRWTATELVANRDKVAAEIVENLNKALPAHMLTDISVKLDDIDYSEAFEKGIESKVLAEQEAQKAKNKTVQIEEEGRQRVIQAKAVADARVAEAEGKAKAMDIEGEAIRRNTQYLDLKKVDAQIEMAKSAQNWQTVIMSEGQAGALLNIPTK